MTAKGAIIAALDGCVVFLVKSHDAKSILMDAFYNAGVFTQDEWSESSLSDSERKKLYEHDKRRHHGHFDPETMVCKFREKLCQGAKMEDLKDEEDDIVDPPDTSRMGGIPESNQDAEQSESKLDTPERGEKLPEQEGANPNGGELTSDGIFDIIRTAIEARKDFENGQQPRIRQRVPEEALRGRDEGTRTLAEASLICRATEGTGGTVAGNNGSGDTTGEGTPQRRVRDLGAARKTSLVQERLLEAYAKSKGIWEDDADIKMKETPEFPEYTEGGETMVFFPADKERPITKLITNSYFPEVAQLIDRIAIHNYLFPGSALTVKGFGRTHADWGDDTSKPMFAVKVEQERVDVSTPASPEQISQHMKSLGFREYKRLASDDIVWESEDGRFVVSDLTDENVVIDLDGNIKVIDANIQLNTPDSDGSGGYKLPPKN